MRLKTKKWAGLLIIAALAILLAGAIDSTPIAQRAIVAGLAIDMDDKKEQVEVTAQILVASGSGSTADAKQVSAKGETISGAFNDVAKQTSMTISLAHCNLVILGENVLKGNAYRVLDYLVRSAYLSENAMILGCLTPAKEILNTKVAFSKLASFYAQRSIFSYGTYEGIVKRSIKSFVVDYNKPCSSNYLPLIEKTKESLDDGSGGGGGEGGEQGGEGNEPKPSMSEEGSGGTGSSGSAGSSEGGGGDEEYLFDLTKTAVLKGEEIVLVLDEKGTTGLNYVMNEVKRGAMTAQTENGDKIELYVIGKKIKKKYDLETRTAKFDLTLSVILKEELKPDADKNYDRSVKMSPEAEAVAAELVRDMIRKVYSDTRAVGCDVFGICEAYHGKYNVKVENDPDFLDSIKLEIDVKFRYN